MPAPGAQGGEHRGEGKDEQDARDAVTWLSAAMKLPEAVATHSNGDARNPDGPERLEHAAAFDDRDIGQQRHPRTQPGRGPA